MRDHLSSARQGHGPSSLRELAKRIAAEHLATAQSAGASVTHALAAGALLIDAKKRARQYKLARLIHSPRFCAEPARNNSQVDRGRLSSRWNLTNEHRQLLGLQLVNDDDFLWLAPDARAAFGSLNASFSLTTRSLSLVSPCASVGRDPSTDYGTFRRAIQISFGILKL
jgi:hypothetical protein